MSAVKAVGKVLIGLVIYKDLPTCFARWTTTVAMPKKRAKKTVRRTPKLKGPSENEIHMKCWQWVSAKYPNLLIFHVANEQRASVQYHVKMKRKGVLAGVADFLVFPTSGRKIAIELKDGEGKQDAEQIKFQKRWERAGGSYYLVRTLADFQAIVFFA